MNVPYSHIMNEKGPAMTEIDEILHLQLIVARLGERELLSWWNTDIAYKLGGADFLGRLLGKEMAPLAAAEGIRAAARGKEEALVTAIPGAPCCSLFCPPLGLRNELGYRLSHFKRYLDDTPAEITAIMDSATEWTVESLRALLRDTTKGAVADYEGTSFGRELRLSGNVAGPGSAGGDEAAMMRALAAAYIGLEKGRFSLPYCRCPDAAR
jgi:hypothetical protein